METSTDSPTSHATPSLPALPETTYATQYTRQHLHEGWQPKGFARYAYQKALLDAMPVLGGAHDLQGAGTNPQRYVPADAQVSE